MTRPSRISTFLTVVLAAMTTISLTGCGSYGDDPVVLPMDPLCEIFPSGQISPMLAPGDYHFNEEGDSWRTIWYDSEFVHLYGNCVINDGQAGYLGVLTDVAYSFTECSSATIFCGDPCDDVAITLTAPSVGQIIGSGGCISKQSSGTYYKAWVQYWGGRYIDDWPAVTKINVSIIPRKGQDGVQDAAQVIQMMLDFLDQSYQADPSAASTQTIAPGATPVPSTPGPS